ncbi:MAG: helix-turn-helix domain-containing protein [Armatimonadota bacterium]
MTIPTSQVGDGMLFASPELQIHGISIHETSRARIVHRPLGMDGFLLTFFHSDALVRLQGVERRVSPSSLVIWEPGQRHYYGNDSGSWEYSWLQCNGVWVLEQLTRWRIPLQTIMPLGSAEETEHCFSTLRHTSARGAAPPSDIMRQILHLWFMQIHWLHSTPPAMQGIPPAWLALKQYLDEHYAEHITLHQLTDRLHISPQHFFRLFKHYFGQPPMEYLKRVRLEHGRQLLLDHNLSIAEIAHLVGYDEYRQFSTLFFQHFGIRPLAHRKEMNGERASARIATERRELELMRWTREGWTLLYHEDFSSPTTEETSWRAVTCHWPTRLRSRPAPELVTIADGCLAIHVENEVDWTMLHFDKEVDEEAKIAVRFMNTPPSGPNLAIAISGDLLTGYRFRIYGYQHLVFETVRNQYWERLFNCQVTLDPHAESYTVVLWRSDATFYAEIDGRLVMTYPDPFAPQGAEQRTVSLGRAGQFGDARISDIKIWKRRPPRYVDILEPGRVLLRQGHRDEALAWFVRVASEPYETRVLQEAQYLTALALPDEAAEEKDAVLQQITTKQDHPFRIRALRELAVQFLQHHELSKVIGIVRHLHAISPDDSLFQHLVQLMVKMLGDATPLRQQEMLTAIAQLPIDYLDLYPTPLTSLQAIAGMQLAHLRCGPGYLDDLSPLSGMPITHFICKHNQLTTLAPLAGMALHECNVDDNSITDVSPLQGMPLAFLSCNGNDLRDLSPIAQTPLRKLFCSNNQLDTLSFISVLPLLQLECANNRLRALPPLDAMPLEDLDCSFNPLDNLPSLPDTLRILRCMHTNINHLRSLTRLQLTYLACNGNAIADLEPLSAMPLTGLFCEKNPITDLSPLAQLPLSSLGIGALPLGKKNIEVINALPLRELYCDWLDASSLLLLRDHPTLESINGHQRAYVADLAPALFSALRAWRKNRNTPSPERDALRSFAMPVGDRA